MPTEPRTFPVDEPSQSLLHKAYFGEQICLALAIQIVLINLLSQAVTVLSHLLPVGMLHMRTTSALGVLLATLAFFCSESHRSPRLQRMASAFALLTTLIACTRFWLPSRLIFSRFDDYLAGTQSRPPGLAVATAFALLGVVIFLIPFRSSILSRIADACACCLAFVVLVLLSESIFAMARISDAPPSTLPAVPTLVCLVLLTAVAILRRAQFGIFAVFLGSGIGGRVARIIMPLLLVVPLLRELGRARLMAAHFSQAHYAAAILTSIATAVSFILLLVLVRVMNCMQNEIHHLTLRDDLTGLYNLRGFYLFAEQAFRLARRARMPFGVLFVDMDNLKIINDELGHSVGSVSLIETAKLLTSTFRETDVIGRIGGDEFVVAGQFDPQEMAECIDRLRSVAATKTLNARNQFFLSLSMGFASIDPTTDETLKSLVTRADNAMYKDKRSKKRQIVA